MATVYNVTANVVVISKRQGSKRGIREDEQADMAVLAITPEQAVAKMKRKMLGKKTKWKNEGVTWTDTVTKFTLVGVTPQCHNVET